MAVEIGNIACRDNSTEFQALTDDGRKVMFLIPNEAILDFLGETEGTVDCPQFVEETTEIFEEMAEDFIARGIEQEPVVIDLQTISDYFM
jgi:hypothetical protein